MYKDKTNQKLLKLNKAELNFDNNSHALLLTGTWLWSTINEKMIDIFLDRLKVNSSITIDASKINSLDTIGAYFIIKIVKHIKRSQFGIAELILPESEQDLFTNVKDQLKTKAAVEDDQDEIGIVGSIGRSAFSFLDLTLAVITFFGQFCVNFAKFLIVPFNLNWNEVSRTVYNAGLRGLGVACLLGFLIGVTLTYEMSPQFITYGANVYIVNFLGIALFKEVTPLLTAIIIAGRTGAAITAEIGVMKVQEEIDALQTMGLSPIRRLVLPKVLGVIIAAPLITAIADVVSMFGGAIIANASLGINYTLFIQHMQIYVSINNYTEGLLKSLVFGFLVALVGCFHGFRVKGNANSIGEETTKSVVLGIILIVFFDAVFAIIFKALGI